MGARHRADRIKSYPVTTKWKSRTNSLNLSSDLHIHYHGKWHSYTHTQTHIFKLKIARLQQLLSHVHGKQRLVDFSEFDASLVYIPGQPRLHSKILFQNTKLGSHFIMTSFPLAFIIHICTCAHAHTCWEGKVSKIRMVWMVRSAVGWRWCTNVISALRRLRTLSSLRTMGQPRLHYQSWGKRRMEEKRSCLYFF